MLPNPTRTLIGLTLRPLYTQSDAFPVYCAPTMNVCNSILCVQKWHERYFLLRANKTIEIHKSRRAAEAQKTPRRVIDLRECISLELGLEYKNLQHILSLGTFKRTFFLGAPSDALMLQWGNVLEKVKGAVSGKLYFAPGSTQTRQVVFTQIGV